MLSEPWFQIRALRVYLPLLALLWGLTPGVAAAQAGRRSVTGRVLDSTGLALVGASVTLRTPSAAFERTTTTNDRGEYEFLDIPDGAYTVSAVLDGFSVSERTVTVSGDGTSVSFSLQPGSFAEEISVLGGRLVGSEEMLSRIPGSVEILGADVLESSHVFTTSEAMRKVTGVQVRDEEGLGLRPNIGIRGLNPTRSTKVLLLEDGVPTTYAPYGDNASYYHPPIERFSRVEVLKGSGQIAYGPVTVGGVVNYITPDPPARRSTLISLQGGNRDFLRGHLSFGATRGRIGLLFDAMRKQADGAREHQHSVLDDLNVKVLGQLSPRQNLSIKANYYGEDSQLGYSGLRDDEYRANPRGNPFVNDHFDGDRGGASGTYRALLRDNVAFTATAYAQVFRRHWWRQSSNSAQRPNDASDPACGGMANLLTTCGNEGRLRAYSLFGVEPRVRVAHRVFGLAQETDAGFRFHAEDQERLQKNGATPAARDGVLVEDNHRQAAAASWFLQHRLFAGRWTVTPGVRVEHIGYDRTNRLGSGGRALAGEARLTEVIPGLGVAYAASPQTTLFAGAHRGFSPPRVEDVITNAGGVVELNPERSWNLEIGGRTLVTQGLHVDGTLFDMRYSNQIVPASLAGGVGATLTNGGRTQHRGVELGASVDTAGVASRAYSLYSRIALTWIPVARFEGTRFSSVPGHTAVSVSGNRLPYAAKGLTTVTVGYRHAVGLDVQLEAQAMSSQFGDDLNAVEGSPDGQRGVIPALTLWNAAATWRLSPLRSSLFVAVKNLTDRTAIVDRARGILPTHPRLAQVGLTVRF